MDKQTQENMERSGLGGLVDNINLQTGINVDHEKRIRSLEKITLSVSSRRLSNKTSATTVDNNLESDESTIKKLYNFLVKSSEEDKKRYEMDKNFEQERREESDRKYDKLVKVVTDKAKLEKKSDEKDGKESFFEKLFNMLKKGIKGILGLLGSTLLGVITAGIKGIRTILKDGIGAFLIGAFNTVKTVISNLFSGLGTLASGIFKFISIARIINTISSVVNLANSILKISETITRVIFGLGKTIAEIVFNILETSARALATLGSRIMNKFVVPFFKEIWTTILRPLIAAVGGPALNLIKSPMGLALASAAIVAGAEEATAPLQYGEKYLKLQKEYDEMKLNPGGRNDPNRQLKLDAKQKEKDEAWMEHQKNVVTPAMLDAGYELVMHTDGDWGWAKPNESDSFIKIGHDEEQARKNKSDGITKGTFDKMADSALEYAYKNLGPKDMSDAIDSVKIRGIVGEYKAKESVGNVSSKLTEKYKQSEEYVSEMADKGKEYASESLTKLKDEGNTALESATASLKGVPKQITDKLAEHGLSIESIESQLKTIQDSIINLASGKYEQAVETATKVSSAASDAISGAADTAEKMMEPVASAATDIAATTSENFEGVNNVPEALNAVGKSTSDIVDRLTGGSPTATKMFSFAETMSNLSNIDVMSGTKSLIGIMAEKANQGLSLDDDKVFSDVVKEFWGKMMASPMGSVPSETPGTPGLVDKVQDSYKGTVPSLDKFPNVEPKSDVKITPLLTEDDVATGTGNSVVSPINNVYNSKTESSGEVYLGSPPVRNQNWSLRIVDITSAVPL